MSDALIAAVAIVQLLVGVVMFIRTIDRRDQLRADIVLLLLEIHGALYGLQLVERSNGTLKRGSIYVLLSRMEDRGLIASRAEPRPDLGLPRRLYTLTDAGRRAVQSRDARG